MKYFDDFSNVAEKLCAKKKLQKNKSTRTIEAIFSSIQNTFMPWGTSENQIQVCRLGKK